MTTTPSHLVAPGTELRLADVPTRADGGMEKGFAKRELDRVLARLDALQELMYAESKHSLLVVLQAMDAGGKDSTIRSVFGPLNPQGCRVASFKAPSREELGHDYLWRVHRRTPARGTIAVFNRSHYEDVLVVRVNGLVPETRWRGRYEQIRAFERLLAEEGTTILKFYLHISKPYQKARFERRLARPDKYWKFNPGDLRVRERWDDYMDAYEEALSQTSTDRAPWYVVPAERRWYRNLIIARTLVAKLESLDMQFPETDYDPSTIVIS